MKNITYLETAQDVLCVFRQYREFGDNTPYAGPDAKLIVGKNGDLSIINRNDYEFQINPVVKCIVVTISLAHENKIDVTFVAETEDELQQQPVR